MKCSIRKSNQEKLHPKYLYTTGCRLIRKSYKTSSFITAVTELEGVRLTEISQTQQDKYHMISFTRGFLKKK